MVTSELLPAFPPLAAYAMHRLAVEAPHELYFEECGNPQGLPILYVHGGPGSGCSEDSRRFFDPSIYRIILFDQRGAGKSTPVAELTHNNTQALVADMEAIREFLNIEHWVLFGGSWGSTLSLIYTQTYPEHVLGLILRGIFLGRRQDLDWIFNDQGVNQIFPDYWEEFISLVPATHRHSPVLMYYELLTSKDEKTRIMAAKTWSAWETKCANLQPRPESLERFNQTDAALSFARIECHYMLNNCFLEPNQILSNMPKIQHIPGIIIHGRYDMVCLLENAWSLHQAWPKSELNIVPNAGHSSSEVGIQDGLIRATKKMATMLKIK